MCEPSHSINQYPTDDPESGAPNESRLRIGLQKVGDWLKRVGRFFHISCLGSGHSESIEWASTRQLWLPNETRYEARWWDRTVHFDGSTYLLKKLGIADEALESATIYSKQVSIGNLSQLRNFLEVSMKKSERPRCYIDRMLGDLFSKKGRNAAYKTWQEVTGNKCFDFRKEALPLDSLIKFFLGFTRNRENLNDAWADDDALWKPKIITA